MTREIKFRVLNALNNMVYFSIFHSGLEGKTFKSPVMQFTGLKDCNKLDIYEGDKIRATFMGTTKEYHSMSGEIIFDNGCFSLKVTTNPPHSNSFHVGSTPCLYNFIELEVIGNIYEISELMQ